MSKKSMSVIETTIRNLQARQPKPRGRREELSPYVEQLRSLIAQGWTRAEIIGEIKALGGKMSPALLRDVLQIPPQKPMPFSRDAKPQIARQVVPTISASAPEAEATVRTVEPATGLPAAEAARPE